MAKHVFSPQTVRIQNLLRREYLVSRLLRNAKEGTFAL